MFQYVTSEGRDRIFPYTPTQPFYSPFTPLLRHSMDIHSYQLVKRAKITSNRYIQPYEHTAF